MFDSVTSDLIRQAPSLEGLQSDLLPDVLTRIYAQLVALRVELGRIPSGEAVTIPEHLSWQLRRLRRLANTHEAFVAVLEGRSNRKSAAFVAATAHQLLARAERLGWLPQRVQYHLMTSAISSSISSVLLFLMAGYQSDAAEAAAQLQPIGQGVGGDTLVQGLVNLAAGDLLPILDRPVLDGSNGVDYAIRDVFDEEAVACEVLWLHLSRGLKGLAVQALGRDLSEFPDAREPMEQFRLVQRLSVVDVLLSDSPLNGRAETVVQRAYSTFAGPHHLATLMIAVGDALMASAIVQVPPPYGVAPAAWGRYVRRVATKRPYLWENHLEAIRGGYLKPGVSAAVSFPTGAGKSTLAELKIAVALEQGRNVVFLTPTHALAWQVRNTLRSSFPSRRVTDHLVGDGFYAEIAEADRADIAVMTPERCLTLLGMAPEDFANVGLLVFDECHLLHPDEELASRRSLDAMLCLLGVLEQAPQCDILLLSAMMSNAREMAAWIGDVTGRESIPLALEWKPTRQARGCLVYQSADLQALRNALLIEQRSRRTVAPGVRIKERLRAAPLGVFSLRQMWSSQDSTDYSCLPVMRGDVELGASDGWQLTANKNKVAAALAAQLANLGVKTLIFVQNKVHCGSTVKAVSEFVDAARPSIELTVEEKYYRAMAIEELGSESCLLECLGNVVAPHHALLLPTERRLNESLFERTNGIQVLVATGTLAQGMNLPAEVVIIAGDWRFDEESQRLEQLFAHELLNAAGRAGRAGHVASGLVVVIPGKPIEVDETGMPGGPAWLALRNNIFSKSDQCLEIQDPIGALLDEIASDVSHPSSALLDRVQHASDPQARLIRYFLTRVPVGVEGETEEERHSVRILSRSLAAFQARSKGQESIYSGKVDLAVNLRRLVVDQSASEPWMEQISRTSGVPIRRLRQLDEEFAQIEFEHQATCVTLVEWLFQWLGADSGRLLDLMNPSVVYDDGLSKNERKAFAVQALDHSEVCQIVKGRVLGWMSGWTYSEIEIALGMASSQVGSCWHAREFVQGLVREVSYAAGLMAQVRRGRIMAQGRTDLPLTLATLGACIREGLDSPAKLAVRYALGPFVSRRECQRIFDLVSPRLVQDNEYENFGALLARVKAAMHEVGVSSVT